MWEVYDWWCDVGRKACPACWGHAMHILSRVTPWNGGEAVLLQTAAWVSLCEPCLPVGALWTFGDHWQYGFACSRMTFSNHEEAALPSSCIKCLRHTVGQESEVKQKGQDMVETHRIQIRSKVLALYFTCH